MKNELKYLTCHSIKSVYRHKNLSDFNLNAWLMLIAVRIPRSLVP
jgi:hypothetical protein